LLQGPRPGGRLQGNPATLLEMPCSMKSMGHDAHAFARLPMLAVAIAVAVFAALLAAALDLGKAGAAPRVVVLGAAAPATPSCPATCQAVGKTTGFQTSITGARNPFVVSSKGRIGAWW